MNNIVEKLAQEGYLSEEELVKIAKHVTEFMLEVRRDPALKLEALKKFAASPAAVSGLMGAGAKGGFLATLKASAPITLAALALGAGVAGGEKLFREGYSAIKDSVMKGKYYKAMIDANPELKKEDPKMVQRAFNTLNKFNPDFASDPLVAGGYVSSAVSVSSFPAQTAGDLVRARKDLASAKSGGGGWEPTRAVQVPRVETDQIGAWRGQAQQQSAQQQPSGPPQTQPVGP